MAPAPTLLILLFLFILLKATRNVRTRVYNGISSSKNLNDVIALINSQSPSESGYGEDFIVAGCARDNYGVSLAAMFVAPVTG